MATKKQPEILDIDTINESIKNVTRFEVIDESSRALVRYGVKVELSLQDKTETLKVFLTSKPWKSKLKTDTETSTLLLK